MHEHDEPKPISAAEHRARIRRIDRIGRLLGFVGTVEYRHVYSHSGGAQYYIGSSAEDDLLVLYAEGFERDADPADFRLEALSAELGQLGMSAASTVHFVERLRRLLRHFV